MISEYDSLLDQAKKRTERASKDYIPQCCEILRKEGLSREKIVHRIRRDFGEVWSMQTIYDAIPEEYKKETKPKRFNPPESILLEQSSVGSHEAREPTIEYAQVPRPSIPEPVIPIHKTIRIEMDWGHCNFFVKWFRQELEQHKDNKDGKYIIEYDIMTKEISVDMES